MAAGTKPTTRRDNIVVQNIDNETLIYDLTKNKAYCLNETSAFVWRECDGTKSVDEISQKISKAVKAPVSADIVYLALSQFKKDGLLEDSKTFATLFDGMSRRDVVKHIGFTSAVALPVISSLIAPNAANAQSQQQACGCFANNNQQMLSDPGCGCLSSLDCCSGLCAGAAGLCGAMSSNPTGPNQSCCPTVVCPPQNAQNIPPGCGCNPSNGGVCASGNCINSVCSI